MKAEELYSQGQFAELCAYAERLESANETLQTRHAATMLHNQSAVDENVALRDQNESLFANNAALRAEVAEHIQTSARLASEAACERLRAEKAQAEVERLKMRSELFKIERDEQRQRVERVEAALREIAVGKISADHDHPLGEFASMAGRFLSIAQTALSHDAVHGVPPPPPPQS